MFLVSFLKNLNLLIATSGVIFCSFFICTNKQKTYKHSEKYGSGYVSSINLFPCEVEEEIIFVIL